MKHQCAEMLIFPGTGAIWAWTLPALRLGEKRISIPSENLGYPYLVCKKRFSTIFIIMIADYKNLYLSWGLDWKFRHEGKLSRVEEFSFALMQQLSRVGEFSFALMQMKLPSLGITVRHHSTSLVMPNSYPRDGIFNPNLTTICIKANENSSTRDNCSASPGKSRNAERNFQSKPHDHLRCVFDQFEAKITALFEQDMFGSASLLYVDVETFGRNWRENDVKTSNMTSKSPYWRHARASTYTPSCKTTFPSSGWVHGNSGRVCKNIRIFHGCEVRTEKAVRGSLFDITRFCRVMPNSDPQGRIFLSVPNNHDRFFFLHTFNLQRLNLTKESPLTSHIPIGWRQIPKS